MLAIERRSSWVAKLSETYDGVPCWHGRLLGSLPMKKASLARVTEDFESRLLHYSSDQSLLGHRVGIRRLLSSIVADSGAPSSVS